MTTDDGACDACDDEDDSDDAVRLAVGRERATRRERRVCSRVFAACSVRWWRAPRGRGVGVRDGSDDGARMSTRAMRGVGVSLAMRGGGAGKTWRGRRARGARGEGVVDFVGFG